MSVNTTEKGIIYVAFGYEYLLMAIHSAMTARQSNPGIRCELVTNVHFDEANIAEEHRFDRVTFTELKSDENRYVKTNIVNMTDLELGVYIDCDTEVRGCLDPVFDCLERFDLAIKLCPRPTRKIYEVGPGISSLVFPEWNGGVLFFRNNGRTKAFFRRWNEIFRAEGKNRDQPALARTVYDSDWGGQLLSLNAVWNTFRSDVRLLKRGMKDSRIWHYRKAEDWPAVAPAILAIHEAVAQSIDCESEAVGSDIREVGRRYYFLSLRLYHLSCRHRVLRENVTKLVASLMKIGAVRPFKLVREDQVAGESYQEIGSEASL